MQVLPTGIVEDLAIPDRCSIRACVGDTAHAVVADLRIVDCNGARVAHQQQASTEVAGANETMNSDVSVIVVNHNP
jgi:hypothetical protein